MSFICENCGNSEEKYFGNKNGVIYCRKCLAFSKRESDVREQRSNKEVVLDLKYSLTREQQKISELIANKISENKNVLVHAVCGAGKTEIVSQIIYKYLQENKRVAFYIPRRDLVIEIGTRLKDLFPNTSISLVYGGNTANLKGSLVISTTHQAFRFKNSFDLAIIDEIDAFPYKDDDLLNHFVFASVKGPIISLSATPSLQDKKNNEVLCLFKRFHGLPMPIPKVIYMNEYYQKRFIIRILKVYQRENKPCFIYVPTIEVGNKLINLILRKYESATFVHSQMPNRNQTLSRIRQGHFTIVVTTTILERGVTFENLQVIIYQGDHFIFDKETILQICGRVGRKKKYSIGDIFILSKAKKIKFTECIQEVKSYNETL